MGTIFPRTRSSISPSSMARVIVGREWNESVMIDDSGCPLAQAPALPRAIRSRQSSASSRAVSAVLMSRSSWPRLSGRR